MLRKRRLPGAKHGLRAPSAAPLPGALRWTRLSSSFVTKRDLPRWSAAFVC